MNSDQLPPGAEPEHPGIVKIKAMFDRGDLQTLEKMVKVWEALESIGAAGDILKRLIVWVGVVAGGYVLLSGYLADWIRSVPK